MKNLPFIIVLLVLLLNACSSGIDKPDPLLTKKQMTELLTEMQLTEATIQQLQTQTVGIENLVANVHVAYNKLFDKYGLTKKSFEANIRYYAYHSREMKSIYEVVSKNLKELDSLNCKERKE